MCECVWGRQRDSAPRHTARLYSHRSRARAIDSSAGTGRPALPGSTRTVPAGQPAGLNREPRRPGQGAGVGQEHRGRHAGHALIRPT